MTRKNTVKGTTAACEGCGAEFLRNSHNHVFCNENCRFLIRKGDDAKAIADWNSRHPANRMLATAKDRAKKKGIDFSITLKDIELPEYCPVLGVKLEVNRGKGHGGRDNSYSLDRIDPTLGYVEGNVQVMSLKANSMKFNATPEELLKFAEWINNTYSLEGTE